jgi:hypothetical protein
MVFVLCLEKKLLNVSFAKPNESMKKIEEKIFELFWHNFQLEYRKNN